MDLLHHLLYQELLSGACTMDEAIETIEKYLISRGSIDPQALHENAVLQAAAIDEAGDLELERIYGAMVVQELFRQFSTAEIRDVINLAHKEALAREIDHVIRDEPVDLRLLEERLAEFARLPVGESQVSPSLSIGIRVRLISLLISDNLFYVGIAKNHITMRDIATMMDRFVGKRGARGRIGGKSAGVILANRILLPGLGESTGLEDRVREVESYFLTAEVFTRFIEANRLEEGHSLKYMEPEEREAPQAELERKFRRGSFPADLEASFRELLDQLGDCPIIVRSSSLLEDSMGFPFYGKYESVFVPNSGTRDQRFEALLQAIKSVYISILASSVLEYRRDKALLDYDDMMCVLVQRVVGARHGSYFFPDAAGVAFSRNQYRWSPRIEAEAGVVRLVFGLGTRAVDRSGDDYPRLVALSHPELRPESTMREQIKYSQRFVDAINLETLAVESVHFTDLVNEARQTEAGYQPDYAISVASDDRLHNPLLFPESIRPGQAAISFDGLIRGTDFAPLMTQVLSRLEEAYGVPVDVEFAWHEGRLHILQCRPLAQGGDGGEAVVIPEAGPAQRVLLSMNRDIFRNASRSDIRFLVHVDGEAYYRLGGEAEKLEVARLVGRVNRSLRGERYMLIGPGRWGTNNLELGVKVSYGDINHACVLAEVGSRRTGYTPEVSYGTHFYQDLVEADIVPLALFPDEPGGSFDAEFVSSGPNCIRELLPATALPDERIVECLTVVDLDRHGPGRLSLYLSAESGRGVGVLG